MFPSANLISKLHHCEQQVLPLDLISQYEFTRLYTYITIIYTFLLPSKESFIAFMASKLFSKIFMLFMYLNFNLSRSVFHPRWVVCCIISIQ